MAIEDYKIMELLAVQLNAVSESFLAVTELWNEELAARFPNADHHECRQLMRQDGDKWVPYSPVRCAGWHCRLCGSPTNIMGHHHCQQ